MSEKTFLNRLMTETWPARMAQDALSALMLPGDVYQGKVSMYGDDGHTNPEIINRSADLAGLLTLGAGAVPAEANSLRSGIKAYHGSPHDFDRFDLSKIGTGEGAQVYGHGLYFADNEAVARSYRDAFAQADMPQKILNSLKAIDYLGFDTPGQAIRAIRSNKDWMKRWDVDPRRSAEEAQAIGNINKYVSSPRAHMYEVNINADPAHFLDWDKPLSAQSETVRKAIEFGDEQAAKELETVYRQKYDAYMSRPAEMDGADLFNMERDVGRAYDEWRKAIGNKNKTGAGVYNDLARGKKYQEGAAALKEKGIPGIKYLDQGSRGAGEGSRNYVVFDDKIIDILKKYGLAGASASPLAALMYGANQSDMQQ